MSRDRGDSGSRSRRRGSALASIGLWLCWSLLIAPHARADAISEAISALSADSLYIASNDTVTTVNPDAVRASLRASSANGIPVKVAVFGDGAGDPTTLASQIGSAVAQGGTLTIGVFVGTRYAAGSHGLARSCASVALSRAVNANLRQLQADKDLTATILRFRQLAGDAPTSGTCSTTGGTATGGSNAGTGSGATSSGGTSGWAVLGLLGVAVGATAGGLMFWRRRRRGRQLADARAELQPFYDRLAAEVTSLNPGTHAAARQALSDASERYNSAGSQLAGARSLAQLGGARRSILEGLQAVRTARTALDLDPGPDLPPIVATNAPQLVEPQQVDLNGQVVRGYPQYAPGAPYYFAGGGGYPGGWYSVPFWQTLLIAEALSPGWGWGFGGWGGGYGGYDAGFDAGYDRGTDVAQASDTDAGSSGSGGGDWSDGGGWSSSGDFGGGDIGGGDFGGGGDVGGGGGGGGDW